MKLVIDLLTEKKESLEKSVRFMKDELVENQNALMDLQSESFIERNKDRSCWSDDWTIHDYIRVNAESRERSISNYSEKISEKSEYISQINKAIEILKGV